MKVWYFDNLYTHTGWQDKAFVVVDKFGNFLSLGKKIPPAVRKQKHTLERVSGWALPGFINAHSHVFQYAMVGLAENVGKGSVKESDDFWSWRENMYALAARLSPDALQKLATLVYKEMLKFGYTKVIEFHYLHHDKNGKPYKKISEMSLRLLAAAEDAGIQICLLPIYYAQSNFGQPPKETQKRFVFTGPGAYFSLVEELLSALTKFPSAKLAVGVHSLRAAAKEDVKTIFNPGFAKLPKHLHIAEQPKEVDDCVGFYGKRPVQWLLDNFDLSSEFNLVHATHTNAKELEGMAKRNVNVVLCPTTEANLGDGIFPLADFARLGGHWCIGSDSQVCLNPLEELRWLDYGQRLKLQRRNVLCSANQSDSGELLLQMARKTGNSAFACLPSPQVDEDFFRVGEKFDVVVIDSDHPQLDVPTERRISALIYGGIKDPIKGTIIGTKWEYKQS